MEKLVVIGNVKAALRLLSEQTDSGCLALDVIHPRQWQICQGTSSRQASRRLCSFYIDPQGISALMACRRVALQKCPGIRSIGIGKSLR